VVFAEFRVELPRVNGSAAEICLIWLKEIEPTLQRKT
jgi:hypothetical protein